MKRIVPAEAERGRLLDGQMASRPEWGMAGMFIIPGPCGMELRTMVSDGADWPFALPAWEHVSVSTASRTPNWREMEFIRDLFFQPDELVLQFSMPRAKHINVHPHCLHMWRPIGVDIPLPPAATVGPSAVSA